jgi:hypothetical protein
MHVELLFWAGCPSHPKALADVRTQMALLGLDPDAVVIREIASESEAEAGHFVGSPTIRVNGADVVDSTDRPAALTCRVYHRRDGRISPTPDPADVHDALKTALAAATDAAQPLRSQN